MRRLLTVAGFAGVTAGAVGLLLAAPVGASTPRPKGTYYGQLSGSMRPITPPATCPVAPPNGTTEQSNCAQIKGRFTIKQVGGKKLAGSYVGTFATGNTDPTGTGTCWRSNASFTFTTSKGNWFKAVLPALSSQPTRVCTIALGSTVGQHEPLVLTTMFNLQITAGKGRFKGLSGLVSEDGSILPNVTSTGLNGATGRAAGNLVVAFGPPVT